MNHVNSKHSANTDNLQKIKKIIKDNPIIVQMENDYGKIITTTTTDKITNEILTKHTCVKCGRNEPTHIQIKGHITAIKCSDLEKREYIDCPYCPENFKDLQTLNRHIYINKTCKSIKNKIKKNEHIEWKNVWKDICNKNRLINNS